MILLRNTVMGAFAFAVTVSASAADGPIIFQPVSDWKLVEQGDVCAVQRDFQSDKYRIGLDFSSFAYGDEFQVRLDSSLNLGTRPKKPRVRFEPDITLRYEASGYRSIPKGGGRNVIFPAFVYENSRYPADPANPEERAAYDAQLNMLMRDHAGRDRREAGITGLYVAASYERDVLLETGELHSAVQMMRECLGALARRDGLDPAKLDAIAVPPQALDLKGLIENLAKGAPAGWAYDRDHATINIRLIVDENGKALDCGVRANGQNQQFDRSACNTLLQYAAFAPARDSDGNPVKAYYSNRIIYH